MSPPHSTSDGGAIPSGMPSPFDLGRLAGHVESMAKELGDVNRALKDKVSHAEFQRAFRNMTALNLLILGAIVGLAFTALRPRCSTAADSTTVITASTR